MNEENQAAPERPEYQKRVIAEKVELDDKLSKLTAFLTKGNFEMSVENLKLLKQQQVVMGEYSTILAKRISIF